MKRVALVGAARVLQTLIFASGAMFGLSLQSQSWGWALVALIIAFSAYIALHIELVFEEEEEQ